MNANGFYQLPADFDVGANLFGRQGYAQPLIIQTGAGADGTVRALADPNLDTHRYDTLWDFDLRVAKTFRIHTNGPIEPRFLLSADLFNVFNTNTVLSRVRRINTSAYQTINEVLSPRILRVGITFQF